LKKQIEERDFHRKKEEWKASKLQSFTNNERIADTSYAHDTNGGFGKNEDKTFYVN